MVQVSFWKKPVVLFALVALVASLCAISAETAFADSGAKLTTQATTMKAKKFSKPSTKAGKDKKSASTIAQVKFKLSGVKGGIDYKVISNGKVSKTAKNNNVAGMAGKATSGLTVKLTGDVAKTYDVYYRVYIKGYGWMGWAKNGKKAGTNDKKKAMSAYEVKLVKREGGEAPDTDRAAYSVKSGFINKITGDSKVDKAIMAFCEKNKMDLQKVFYAMKKANGYGPTGDAAIKGTMSNSRFKKEAKRFFKDCKNGKIANGKGKGDCYTVSAAIVAAAKYLGYKTKVICGTATNSSGRTQDYSWAEILVKGKPCIFTYLTLPPMYANPYDEGKGLQFHKS